MSILGFGNKSRIKGSAFLNGSADIHCHILTGVDDGFDSLSDSLELLRLEEEAGIKRIYLTPHMMGKSGAVVDPRSYGGSLHRTKRKYIENYKHSMSVQESSRNSVPENNSKGTAEIEAEKIYNDGCSAVQQGGNQIIPSSVLMDLEEKTFADAAKHSIFSDEPLGGFSKKHIEEIFDKFKKNYKGSLDLRLAAEYMMNAEFLDLVKKKELITYSDKKHILVETSYFFPPVEMEQILYELSINGYVPIIAHPERYNYMGRKDYDALKEKGYAFQLNYLSLTGYYGETIYKKAIDLMDAGYYNFTGSDFHRVSTWYHQMHYLNLNRKHTRILQELFQNNLGI